MINIFRTYLFRKKKITQETPILDACDASGISREELKEFLDKYKEFLMHGTAAMALNLHKDSSFQEIQTTGQALNAGQNCFADFVTMFYVEYYAKKQEAGVKIDVYEEELDRDVEKM